MTEHELYIQIARYLRLQYPKVIYRFDLAADMKLTPGQAAKHKRLHPFRGYPDLFIAQPQGKKHGLFIEIKKDGTRILKKNGDYSSDHIAEQAEMLQRLEKVGYRAMFGVGFDQVKQIIDEYFGKGVGTEYIEY